MDYAANSPLMRQIVDTWYAQHLEAWADWVEMAELLGRFEQEGGA